MHQIVEFVPWFFRLIAALTCGAGGEPQVRRLSRQVKSLVPAQGDGARLNEVSAAIPGDVVDWNAQNSGAKHPPAFVGYELPSPRSRLKCDQSILNSKLML